MQIKNPKCGPRLQIILTGSLWRATFLGNLKEVKELVAAGADINIQDSDLMTPLMVAVQYSNLSLIEYFLEMKAQVNSVDVWGKTALMIACQEGHLQCVKAIVYSWLADIDKTDNNGNTALALTAFYLNNNGNGLDRLECMKVLLEQDADANIKDDYSVTPCMHCIKHSDIGWEGIDMLFKSGADPLACNATGENLLMIAAIEGQVGNLQRLLDLGIYDLTTESVFGDNALILALYAGKTECVDRLLQAGSDPNSMSCHSCYALSVAASNGFEDTLLLLKYGAIPMPGFLYVREDILHDEDLREALIFCNQTFHPTDMAVLYRNFSTAYLLSTILFCNPLYQVNSDHLSKVNCPYTKVVVDYIRSAAKSCPDWVKMSSEFMPRPSSLALLSQQAISKLVGFSKLRFEILDSCGLPPKLVRYILYEGLEEQMFVLPVLDVKTSANGANR